MGTRPGRLKNWLIDSGPQAALKRAAEGSAAGDTAAGDTAAGDTTATTARLAGVLRA